MAENDTVQTCVICDQARPCETVELYGRDMTVVDVVPICEDCDNAGDISTYDAERYHYAREEAP